MKQIVRASAALVVGPAALAVASPALAQAEEEATLTAPANQTAVTMGDVLVVEGQGCRPGAGVVVLLGGLIVGFEIVDDDATFSTPIVVPVVDLADLPEAGEVVVQAICEETDSTDAAALVVLEERTAPRSVIATVATSTGGLRIVETTGDVLSLDADDVSLDAAGPIVAVSTATGSATGAELWGVTPAGTVVTTGGAALHGDLTGVPVNAPTLGLAATPDGGGYWLAGADGGVFAFGDATFHGSMGGRFLVAPVVGMTPTPSGNGYWLVAADGGVFAFGDAGFFGSMGGVPLAAPVLGMVPTASGNGYWLVAADGGVFAFGDAAFLGSLGGAELPAPIVDIAAHPDGLGYWLTSADGTTIAFPDVESLTDAG